MPGALDSDDPGSGAPGHDAHVGDDGLALADGFPYVEDLVAPGDPASGVHVVNHEIQRLLADAWVHYLSAAFDGDTTRAFALRPTVREVLTGFLSECFPEEVVQCGVRAASRGQTSYVLEEALWHAAEQRLVATARVVLVAVDPATGRPSRVPDDWWATLTAHDWRT